MIRILALGEMAGSPQGRQNLRRTRPYITCTNVALATDGTGRAFAL